MFIRTYRDLSRLKSVAASPVISHLGETLNGTSTIRAFKKEKDFIEKNNDNLNIKLNIFFWKAAVKSWFGVRVGLVALAIFIFTSSF
jgi:ATP-binding cassette, subfamily C (CFTR/MRP), member 1